jgi:hypothetical protein
MKKVTKATMRRQRRLAPLSPSPTYLIVLFLVMLLGSFCFLSFNQSFETKQKLEFQVDKKFNDFRRSLKDEDLMNKTIASMGGSIIDKEWTEAKVSVQRPILKNWHFDGNVVFKFIVPNNNKECLFHVSQKLIMDNDKIQCENKLIEPVKELGLKEYEQNIFINRNLDDKTLVELKAYMKIKRFVPFFLKEYAQDKLDKEALNQIEKLKESIINLPQHTDSISIRIK